MSMVAKSPLGDFSGSFTRLSRVFSRELLLGQDNGGQSARASLLPASPSLRIAFCSCEIGRGQQPVLNRSAITPTVVSRPRYNIFDVANASKVAQKPIKAEPESPMRHTTIST